MYSQPLARPAYLGNTNTQNQNTGDASLQLPPTQNGLHESVNLTLPIPNAEGSKTPTNSGRRLPPTPNNGGLILPPPNLNQPIQIVTNATNVSVDTPSLPLPLRPTSNAPIGGVNSVERLSNNGNKYQPNPNAANIGMDTSPPIRPNTTSEHLPHFTSKRSLASSTPYVTNNNGSTTGDGTSTPPVRPTNLSYAQQPVISSVYRPGVNASPQRPNNNNNNNNNESLSNSSSTLNSNRSSSSRTPNVTNNNGLASVGDQSSRSGSFGSSIKFFAPTKSSSKKSSSNINNSSDSISEKGSQLQSAQQGTAAFKYVYPCLAQHEDLQNFSSVEQVENYFKSSSHESVLPIFKHIQAVQYLFPLTGIDQPEWAQIDQTLDMGIENLEGCVKNIDALTRNNEKTGNLLACLSKELSRQLDYLRDKKLEVHNARHSDPFSEKGIKHYGVLCSSLIEELFNAALADVIKVKKEKYEKKIQKNAAEDRNTYDEFDQFDSSYIEKLFDIHRPVIKKFQAKKQQEYDQARSDVRFDIPKGDTLAKEGERLVKKEKKEALQVLINILKKIGFQGAEIDKFIKGIEEKNAMRQALNKQEPPNEKYRIVTSLNGVAGRFDIELIYDEDWKSSTDKSADGLPRNLKIHRLYMITDDGERILLRNFIGNGVLDAWREKDGITRSNANKNAAIKVVQKAIESNPRVIEICNQGYTPKIVHVSELLVTPTPLPDALDIEILADAREKIFLLNQFKAFEDVIQEKEHKHVFEVHGTFPDVEIIAVGFGTNDLATGESKSKITGGWGYVKEQNDKSMQSFFGNGFDKHEQGKIPGGLIGNVMNDIKNSSRLTDQQKQSYLIDLRIQTDSILNMYNKEDYKYSKDRNNKDSNYDDPIKMNRELEELVSTANEALAAIGSHLVITFSKGCKSDKDRGGMTAAEIIFNAIRKALGLPRLNYNEPLSKEEEDLYVAIAALFSYNQQLNTGLRGNKADGRTLPSKKQAYLDGLEKSAKG